MATGTLPGDYVAIYRRSDTEQLNLVAAFATNDEAGLDAARVVAERLRWTEGDEFVTLCLMESPRRFYINRWATVTGGDPLPTVSWSPDHGWRMTAAVGDSELLAA